MNLSSTGLTRALLGSCLSIAMLRIAMEVNTQYGICDENTCDDSDDDDDDDDDTDLYEQRGEELGEVAVVLSHLQVVHLPRHPPELLRGLLSANRSAFDNTPKSIFAQGLKIFSCGLKIFSCLTCSSRCAGPACRWPAAARAGSLSSSPPTSEPSCTLPGT